MRKAKVQRKTKETTVAVAIAIDGSGKRTISTSIPFMDHMLDLLAQHGLFDITVRAQGDIEVDYHHTVEDIGIALGGVLKRHSVIARVSGAMGNRPCPWMNPSARLF